VTTIAFRCHVYVVMEVTGERLVPVCCVTQGTGAASCGNYLVTDRLICLPVGAAARSVPTLIFSFLGAQKE
jgi:hypothetical protein